MLQALQEMDELRRQRDELLDLVERLAKHVDDVESIPYPLKIRFRVLCTDALDAITRAKREHPWKPATSAAGVKHFRREK